MNVALVVEYVFEATFLPLDSETKQEDTESVASTVTSDISSKNQQSESLQTKVKSKPIKTTASTSQSRLVHMRLRTECYTFCDRSNETCPAILSHGTIFGVCYSNFGVCGRNPMVLPFKCGLLNSIFTCYYLFCTFILTFEACA